MTDQSPPVRNPRPEPLSVLWSVLAAPQVLAVLLGFLALVLIARGLVPQIPPLDRDDPQTWLALRPGLEGWRLRLVESLALYDIYQAFWFRVLVVLVGLVLAVRLVDAAELAWLALAARSGMDGTWLRWMEKAPRVRIATRLLHEEALDHLRGFLVRIRYRCQSFPDQVGPNLIASRRHLVLWARPLGYGALLVALAGLAILDSAGWESEDWIPVPGETRTVGRGTPLAVRLDRFEMQWTPEGRLRGYKADVTWLAGDQVLGLASVGVAAPATRQGTALRLLGYVPVVRIWGLDDGGRVLALQEPGAAVATPGEATIVFPSVEAQPVLFLPDQELLLALTFGPAGAEDVPALGLALSPDEPAADQISAALYGSGPVSLGALELEIDLGYRPVMRFDHRPGMSLILAGLAVALAALAAAWLAPAHLVWIVLPDRKQRPTGEGETGSDPGSTAARPDQAMVIHVLTYTSAEWSRWWHRLTEELREELTSGN